METPVKTANLLHPIAESRDASKIQFPNLINQLSYLLPRRWKYPGAYFSDLARFLSMYCLLHDKGVRNWLISIGFSILVAKIFEIFGFDAGFEGPQPYSKFSILISNRNLLLRNFWLRFRNIIWNYQHFRTYLSNGKQEIWGMWRHCHLIRIFKNLILVVVLVLNIAAQANWFWFWFRICSK